MQWGRSHTQSQCWGQAPLPLAGEMYIHSHTQSHSVTCSHLHLKTSPIAFRETLSPLWVKPLQFLTDNISLRNNILDVGYNPSARQLLILAREYEVCSSPEIRLLELRTQNLANLLRYGGKTASQFFQVPISKRTKCTRGKKYV